MTRMSSAVAQPCPALCEPLDGGPPGSSVHGILQGRILQWVAISSSRRYSRPGTEPVFPLLQADSLLLSHQGSPCCMHASRELWIVWQEAVPSAGVAGYERAYNSGIRLTQRGRDFSSVRPLLGCLLYRRYDFSFCHQVVIAAGTSSVGHFLCCSLSKEIVALPPESHCPPIQGVPDF